MATVSRIARRGQRTRTPGEALRAWLMDHHYSQHAWAEIVAYAEREGTPTGCPDLDPEDEAAATEAFVAAMEPVGPTSSDWGNASDCPSLWNPLDDRWKIGPGPTLRAVPPELEDDEDAVNRLLEAWEVRHEAESEAIERSRLEPPAEPDPPYEPTDEDLADYAAWSADVERRREREESRMAHDRDRRALEAIRAANPLMGRLLEAARDAGYAHDAEERHGRLPYLSPAIAALEALVREALDREVDRARLAADPELAAIAGDEPSLAAMYDGLLPPIAGGAPEPYQPTPADWADVDAAVAADDAARDARRREDIRNPMFGYE